jgi:hypothetical protein
MHGRAQVALPSLAVLSGQTLDISSRGLCVLLDDPIPADVACTLRFEMFVNGKTHVFTASARSGCGVFASHGGFRVDFEFVGDDLQRTALINSLAGKKPLVDPDTGARHPT